MIDYTDHSFSWTTYCCFNATFLVETELQKLVADNPLLLLKYGLILDPQNQKLAHHTATASAIATIVPIVVFSQRIFTK